MARLVVGSLCSGYGGLEMAVRGAYGRTSVAWHTETDPDAAAILRRHSRGVPNHGDITAVNWRRVEPVDVLCAGVPCQSVSAAGRQLGADDPRWLWPAAHRAIAALRPAVVVFENVRNLAGGRHRPLFDAILTDLAGSGYRVRWTILGACAVGACHHRHRLFVLADRTGRAGVERVVAAPCGAPRGGPALLPTPMGRDGDPRHRGEGSAAYWSARRGVRPRGKPLGAAVALLPTPRAGDGRHGSPNQGVATGDFMLSAAVIGERYGVYAAAVNLWAEASGVGPPEPTEPGPRSGVRLAAAFPEWMMGLPVGYLTGHVDRTAALRIAGNGVMPAQGTAALRLLRAHGNGPAR